MARVKPEAVPLWSVESCIKRLDPLEMMSCGYSKTYQNIKWFPINNDEILIAIPVLYNYECLLVVTLMPSKKLTWLSPKYCGSCMYQVHFRVNLSQNRGNVRVWTVWTLPTARKLSTATTISHITDRVAESMPPLLIVWKIHYFIQSLVCPSTGKTSKCILDRNCAWIETNHSKYMMENIPLGFHRISQSLVNSHWVHHTKWDCHRGMSSEIPDRNQHMIVPHTGKSDITWVVGGV